jgi:hypothetical protein
MGDFNQIAQSILAQLATVWRTPVSFFAALIASWFLIRWHINGQFETRISNSQSTIDLQDRQLQDYKDKLDGATPDAAKARIDALEERIDQILTKVAAVTPRQATAEQRQVLAAALDPFHGSLVSIASDAASADAAQISHGLTAAFNAAGWQVENAMVLGLGNPPMSGIGLIVPTPELLTPQQEAIAQAFRAAGLKFDLQAGNSRPRSPLDQRPAPVAEIVLTNRLQD